MYKNNRKKDGKFGGMPIELIFFGFLLLHRHKAIHIVHDSSSAFIARRERGEHRFFSLINNK